MIVLINHCISPSLLPPSSFSPFLFRESSANFRAVRELWNFLEEEKSCRRIWPEQQKSPTSTSSNFNLLHQTLHTHAPPQKHIIPNQPQEAATSSSTEHIIIDHHSRQWNYCWTRQGKISPRPYASKT